MRSKDLRRRENVGKKLFSWTHEEQRVLYVRRDEFIFETISRLRRLKNQRRNRGGSKRETTRASGILRGSVGTVRGKEKREKISHRRTMIIILYFHNNTKCI